MGNTTSSMLDNIVQGSNCASLALFPPNGRVRLCCLGRIRS